MPDTLNKQTLINLLIDSPLREPIKINLIDIINNTSEPDLPKVYPTIVKELEIFQKATERRMKLADETIAKLGGTSAEPSMDSPLPPTSAPVQTQPTAVPISVPTLDLPPLPTPTTSPTITTPTEDIATTPKPTPTLPTEPLSVPPLDLPPLPQIPSTPVPTEPTLPTAPTAAPTESTLPTPQPLGGATPSTSSDEDALAEIQKELESLKAGVAADANPTSTPSPTV